MDYRLIFVFVLLLIVIALICMRKLGKAAIAIGIVLVAFAALVGVVLFAPSSSISIWVTERVAPTISFDSNDAYEDGEVIMTFKVLQEGETSNTKSEVSITSSLKDIKKTAQDFIEDRVSALVKKRLVGLKENYVLCFKDAYMILVPDEMSVSIIKGKLEQQSTGIINSSITRSNYE